MPSLSYFTYCDGVGCILRERCRRFVDGQRIKLNREKDSGQYYWMSHCDIEAREGYKGITR